MPNLASAVKHGVYVFRTGHEWIIAEFSLRRSGMNHRFRWRLSAVLFLLRDTSVVVAHLHTPAVLSIICLDAQFQEDKHQNT